MDLIRKISIKQKLMKVSMLTTCAALLLTSVLLIVNEVLVFRQSLIERVMVMGKTIGANSTAALTFNDQKTAHETLYALKSVPSITCAVLYNREGEVLSRYIRDAAAEDCGLRSVGPDGYRIGIANLDIVQPINLDNENIGKLYIQSDLQEIYDRIQWYVVTVCLVMLLAIAIAFMLISRLQKIITKPLSDMAETMRAISEDKNYSVRVAIQSQDEVGLLGAGFNEMLSQIQKRDRELEAHREHLEEMIGIRTGELARTTNFLEDIFNSSLDGIITTDVRGKIIYASPRIKDILGYEQNDVLGKKIHLLWMRGREESENIMRELLKKGAIKAYELRALTKAGEPVVLNIALSLLRDEKGKVTGTTGFYRDVTEEKKMIEATEQAKQRAEAANKAKSQFLANMSHEIRTPLNGIMGMAEVCLETALDEEQKHIVGAITKEADSLLGIINEILDFSKIEAGKLEIEHIPFDLRNLFEDVTDSFIFQTTQKGLALISSISPETPTRIMGDPGRLRQILKNLIGNAIKFTPAGRIVFKAEPAGDTSLPGDPRFKLRFLVTDTGIGIPKEKQALIFESFTQADGSTTRRFGGTGLGITISKQLAGLMGGEIGLDSEEGKGSTFWFTSVFSRQSEAELQKRKDAPLDNIRVLVVDDNNASRQTIVEYMRSWGSVPVEAASAKEALAILRGSITDGEAVNLVLSELNIREMNGFDLAREIRTEGAYNPIPIIIFTPVGNPGDGKTCRDIGIAGYLTKPIRERELRRIMESVLWPSGSGASDRGNDLVTRHTTAEEDRKDIRILLAEDYPTNQEIAKRHIEHAGYQVDVAENGKLAFEAFKSRHYDLILMDVQMPVMDGYQTTRAIRELEAELAVRESENVGETIPRVPIIAMTAHALSEHKELCLAAGMDDFLSKPLTRKNLLSMLARWLDGKESAECSVLSAESASPSPQHSALVSQSSALSTQSLVFNPEKAIDEFEGDRDLLSQVIAGFTGNVGEQIGTIREALSRGDAETVRREAHSIKGGAAGLTAEKLAKSALDLESKGKSKDLDGAGEIFADLEREFNVFRKYIEENFT